MLVYRAAGKGGCVSADPVSSDEEEAPIEDPYEPLLPHEPGTLTIAPFRLRVPVQKAPTSKVVLAPIISINTAPDASNAQHEITDEGWV